MFKNTLFTKGSKNEFYLYSAVLFVFFLSIAVLVSVFISSDTEKMDLSLEFEAYKEAANLLELFSRGDLDLNYLPPKILGFGIYTETGLALVKSGTAPVSVIKSDSLKKDGLRISEKGSVILQRALGTRPMQGRNGMTLRRSEDEEHQKVLGTMNMVNMPGILFIEYDAGKEIKRKHASIGILFLVISFLILVYISMVLLIKKIGTLRNQSEKMRELAELGEASRILSHEIKNPLGIMSIQCATLDKILPIERKANIDVLKHEIDRLAKMTDRVSEFLHNPEGRPESVSINELLKNISSHYDGKVSTHEVEEEIKVIIDKEKLNAVFDNLIRNAIEEHERLNIAKAVEVSCVKENRFVKISVIDHGEGVLGNMEARLFTPFATNKVKGSGIGLALSKRSIEGAKGTLEYKKASTGGAEFLVRLPIAK